MQDETCVSGFATAAVHGQPFSSRREALWGDDPPTCARRRLSSERILAAVTGGVPPPWRAAGRTPTGHADGTPAQVVG